ncbi:MAG: 30S ribosomal protein S8 [Proteobacteria bacterium]|nr:30S ribosomal protein S8 [Pseudomonadota bacterium]
MAITDPISDLLSVIRNGQSARLAVVTAPASRLKKDVLQVLKDEGFIREFSEEVVREGVKKLNIELKYVEGEPAIRTIKRISKPGLRNYSSVTKLPKVHNGLGISIISTPKGVMSDHKARAANLGGEVLCSVF